MDTCVFLLGMVGLNWVGAPDCKLPLEPVSIVQLASIGPKSEAPLWTFVSPLDPPHSLAVIASLGQTLEEGRAVSTQLGQGLGLSSAPAYAQPPELLFDPSPSAAPSTFK